MNDQHIYEMGEKIASMVQAQFGGTEVFAVLTAMRLATLHLEIRSEAEESARFSASLEKMQGRLRSGPSATEFSSCEAPR
jgi:hypothetical protein